MFCLILLRKSRQNTCALTLDTPATVIDSPSWSLVSLFVPMLAFTQVIATENQMRGIRHRLIASICILASPTLVSAQPYVDDGHQKRVLVLHELGRESTTSVSMDDIYREILGQALGRRLDYYSEYVDRFRFDDPRYEPALRTYLRTRYADQPFDVVIATTTATFRLARHGIDDMFPGAQIVFHAGKGVPREHNSTGVESSVEMAPTLELALALHPSTRVVAVVAGTSQVDRAYGGVARAQFRAFENRVTFKYLYGLPLADLERAVVSLPQDSIIYFVVVSQDGAGERYLPRDVLDRLTAIAPVPVYSWHESWLGHGIVGGPLFNSNLIADATAKLALRILGGESPDSIPITEIEPYVTRFDWRQLRRWGISEASLPAGSVTLFREPGAVQRYGPYIATAIVIIVVQTGLIAGLLVQRRRRRAAEQVVRTSELALRTSHARIWDLAGRLMNAQEIERTRIARDLHDDACQEVAGISVEVSHLRQRQGRIQDPAVQEALLGVQQHVATVAERLRLLSHDLHPALLQHIGLLPALQSHCAEVERIHQLQVSFIAEDETEPVNPGTALSLFRVAQEALRNASTHGHARHATVSLTRTNGNLRLAIEDDGDGFDLVAARSNGGLGLVSIEERARLLKGEATVRSGLRQGTTIQVEVPDPPTTS